MLDHAALRALQQGRSGFAGYVDDSTDTDADARVDELTETWETSPR